MFVENDSLIKNLATIFSCTEALCDCCFTENETEEDFTSNIEDLISDCVENNCFGAYSDGTKMDEKLKLSLISFKDQFITDEVRKEAVKYYSDKFEEFIKTIFIPLYKIFDNTLKELNKSQSNGRTDINLYITHEGLKKESEQMDKEIKWCFDCKFEKYNDAIPVRIIKNGFVSYINLAFVKKDSVDSHIENLKTFRSYQHPNSEILSEFLDLVTEDVELLKYDDRINGFGYIKTIIIGVDTENLKNSIVIDADTIDSVDVSKYVFQRQHLLLEENISRLIKNYLKQYSVQF